MTTQQAGDQKIWAYLLHLSYNMWWDHDGKRLKKPDPFFLGRKDYLRYHSKLADELLPKMAESGLNMVIIDLGDGVKYRSHPEIAVRNAWTTDRLKKELDKMRKLNLEPIPKLNFSSSHDTWLGPYSRCLSTDTYYGVCRDLIAEVIDLFDGPRFFHLGMDEETARHQRSYDYVVVRQGNLWWNDFYLLINEVEKGNVRPWIWSDYVWEHSEEFFKKMPKSVLQSNWYYGASFSKRINYVKAYLDLEAHGYDQVPTGSNTEALGYRCDENFSKTVSYCNKVISPDRLLGFMQTVWLPTLGVNRQKHLEAIDLVGKVVEQYSKLASR